MTIDFTQTFDGGDPNGLFLYAVTNIHESQGALITLWSANSEEHLRDLIFTSDYREEDKDIFDNEIWPEYINLRCIGRIG